MIINATHRQLKMAAILTALALGFGALAACLVPWFYCKPRNDDGDDDREAIAVQTATDSASQSRSSTEDNSSSSLGIRINGLRGFNFLKVLIPRESVTSSASGQSASRESPSNSSETFPDEFHRGNLSNEQSRHFEQRTEQSVDFTSGSSGISKAQNISNVESTKNNRSKEYVKPTISTTAIVHSEKLSSGIMNSETLRQRTLNPSTLNPETINSGFSTSESINSGYSISGSLPARNNPTLNSPASLAFSKLTIIDESSMKTTNATSSSCESDRVAVSRQNTINDSTTVATSDSSKYTNESSTETTNNTSASQETENTTALSGQIGVNFSATSTASASSECTDESSTETISGTWTSQETEKLTTVAPSATSINPKQSSTQTWRKISTPREFNNNSRSTKIVTFASIECPKKTLENLETVRGISICTEISNQLSPLERNSATKFNNEEDSDVNVDSPITPISAGNLNRSMTRFNNDAPLNYSYDEISLDSSTCKKHKRKKSVRRSRYTVLTDGIKKVWRGMKLDRSSREYHDENDSDTKSVCHWPIGSKVPVGQSTMIQGKSTESIADNGNSLKHYDDPRIGSMIYSNSIMEFDEEPLDLSINSAIPSSSKQNNGCTSGFGREIFREFTVYWRAKRVSTTSEEGTMRSDSIAFYHDPSKHLVQDENQNIYHSSGNNNVKIDETSKMEEYPGDNRHRMNDSVSTVSTNDKGLTRKFKKMFNLPSKIGDKILSSGRKGKNSRIVPIEFQRDSTETLSRSMKNLNSRKTGRTFESPDLSSYLELRFNVSTDKESIEPCTEL